MTEQTSARASTPRSSPRRGFGIAATLSEATVREIAPAAEEAGYRTCWTNDIPQGDGPASLRAVADVTDEIRLGVGLLPLDRWPPARIAARIEELRLPRDRLVLGVGSGAGGGLDCVREAIGHLRRLLDVPIVVGALGPKMCGLAGELADGVLLDWVTPSHARRSRSHAVAAAEDASRPAPEVAAYVFSALGAAAARKLQDEIDHYTAVPAYGSHFDRMSEPVERATVSTRTTEGMQLALQRFDEVVDETVVRAVTVGEQAADYLPLLTAAAPNRGHARG